MVWGGGGGVRFGTLGWGRGGGGVPGRVVRVWLQTDEVLGWKRE